MYSQKLLVGNILHGFWYFAELKAHHTARHTLQFGSPQICGQRNQVDNFPNFYQNSQQLYKEYPPSPMLADSAIVIEKAAQK